MQGAEHPGQSTVAAAAGVHNLGRENSAVFHIVNLKLGRMAEVLENFAVFIGYRNTHGVFSFRFCKSLVNRLLVAAAVPAAGTSALAELIVAAFNTQGQSVYQYVRQLFSCFRVDLLHGGPGDLHPLTGLLLRKALFVHQADGLVFLYGQNDGFHGLILSLWGKGQRLRKVADPSAFFGP